MRRFLLLGATFGLAGSAAAQAAYPLTFGGNRDAGNNTTAIPAELAATPDGGSVIGGVFSSNIDVDPGTGVTLYQTGLGGILRGSFISSYSSAGALRFGIPILPTPEGAEAVLTDLTVDAAGNIYAIGAYSGTITVGATAITAIGDQTGGNAGLDLFLVSYTAAGAPRWAISIDGPDLTTDYKVIVDAMGSSVWISGNLGRDTPTDFDGGPGTRVLTAAPGSGSIVLGSGTVGFIASYASANGALQTATLVQGPGQLTAADIAPRPGGGVVLYGGYFGDIDFGLAPGVGTLRNQTGLDLFVAQYDATPALVGKFALDRPTSDEDTPGDVNVAPDGSIYISGAVDRQTDLDPGPGEVFQGGTFLAAYTSAGAYRYNIVPRGREEVALNPAGTLLVVTGQYLFGIGDEDVDPAGVGDFDPGPGVVRLPTNGARNAFVQAFDAATGVFRFASGLVSADEQSETTGTNLAITPSGSILVSGTFVGTTDFDPGAGVANKISTRAFSEDFFITQLSSTGAYQPAGATPNEGGPDDERRALSVFPNPARAGAGQIAVEADGDTRVSVYDALGREVAVLFDGAAGAGQTLALRVPATLAPGTYVVHAISGVSRSSVRISVVR